MTADAMTYAGFPAYPVFRAELRHSIAVFGRNSHAVITNVDDGPPSWQPTLEERIKLYASCRVRIPAERRCRPVWYERDARRDVVIAHVDHEAREGELRLRRLEIPAIELIR